MFISLLDNYDEFLEIIAENRDAVNEYVYEYADRDELQKLFEEPLPKNYKEFKEQGFDETQLSQLENYDKLAKEYIEDNL